MSNEEIYFDIVCGLVHKAYTESKLDALCGKPKNFSESLTKKHLDSIRDIIKKKSEFIN